MLLLIPIREYGSRYCNSATNQHFQPTRRSMGTSNQAWCGWVYMPTAPAARALFFSHTTSGGRIGWSLYCTADYKVRVYWTTGENAAEGVQQATSGVVFTLAAWHFVVANVDRAANITVYVDDMSTAVLTQDIYSLAAVNWQSGANPWRLSAIAATTTQNQYLSRIGYVIGDVLSADDRVELLGLGRGKKFAELSLGLAEKFSAQDYFDCDESISNRDRIVNKATPERTCLAYAGTELTTGIASWRNPKQATP